MIPIPKSNAAGTDVILTSYRVEDRKFFDQQHHLPCAGVYIPEIVWTVFIVFLIPAINHHLCLKQYIKYLTSNLSGGWKQRLALACAVVHRPKILFLDEPTAGIDPVSRRMMWDFLYDLSRGGMTLFVTTHYMEEAERCNKIGFIWEGNLVAYDTPQGIKDNFNLYQIIKIHCENINEVFQILQRHELIKDLTINGDALHLPVENADSFHILLLDFCLGIHHFRRCHRFIFPK